MNRPLLILLLCLCPLLAIGQNISLTTVVGEVRDKKTGETLSAVSVYFEGTHYGTSSTEEGVFLLRAPLTKRATMVVSAVGYRTERFKVEAGSSVGINVELREEQTDLADVFVLPRQNPAWALLDSVRKHRKDNDLSIDTTNVTSHTDVYLSDLRSERLSRPIGQSIKEAVQMTEDSTLVLPLYRRYIDGSQREEQTAILTESMWQLLLDEPYHTYNFYRNYVTLCGSSFISPLASSGKNYYRYIVTDSISEGGKAYRVQCESKVPYDATFNGTLLIDSATYALREVEMSVSPLANVNYLRDGVIVQHYDLNTNNRYHLTDQQKRIVMDVAVKSDSSHIFPTLLVKSSIRLPQTAETHTLLSSDIEAVKLEPMVSAPILNIATFIAKIILTGYIPTGSYVDFGHALEILRVNPYEGVRLGLPIRTNERLWKNVSLEGYVAFGLGDRACKGAGKINWQLPVERRHILSLEYRDAYAISDADEFTAMRRENEVWNPERPFMMFLTEGFFKAKQLYLPDARKKMLRLQFENDWADGWETHSYLAFGQQGYGEPTRVYSSQPYFQFARLGTTLRMSWDDRNVDIYFKRLRVYGDLPVVFVNGEIGSAYFTGRNTYDLYAKLRLMVHQDVPLGVVGRLDYLFEAGTTVGKVPDVYTYKFAGNQTYGYDPYAFTLLPYCLYSAKHYIALHTEWNGRGCIYNRIPWVQRLQLRELISLKMAYGGSMKIPYLEAGVGIGNLFRIGDLYAVWRLTHRNDPNALLWGIRFRLKVET